MERKFIGAKTIDRSFLSTRIFHSETINRMSQNANGLLETQNGAKNKRGQKGRLQNGKVKSINN